MWKIRNEEYPSFRRNLPSVNDRRRGYVKPGDIAFSTDSHTATYGFVLVHFHRYPDNTNVVWEQAKCGLKVPQISGNIVNGKLPENVRSKDIILRLIGDLGADGATYLDT